jgi:phage terminase large subunit
MSAAVVKEAAESLIQLPADGWHARPYQQRFWHAMEKGCRRAVMVWHRRGGKDQCALNWTAVASAQRRGTYWHVLPTLKQARKIIWDGMDKKGRKFLDAFPADYIANKWRDEMKHEFANGSMHQLIGADDPDVANIGTNPVGVVFSEFATTPKMRSLWDYVRPILLENGGWAIFPYTPRGKNHGYKLYEMAKDQEDWFCERLTVEDTWYEENGVMRRVFTEEDIESERRSGMSEAMIRQEYFCDFTGPLESAFYGDAMTKCEEEERIGEVPWDTSYPTVTSWDLGIMDKTVVWFTQEIKGDHKHIDYYEGRGMPFEHYLSHVLSKPYHYTDHIGPHDLKHRDLSTGHSLYEVARNFNVFFRVAPKLAVKDGIAAVRSILPRSYFDAEKCARGIQALKEYRRQKDEANDDYLEQPVHDWASHAADAMRTYAMGRRAKATWAGGERPFTPLAIV